MPTTSSHLRRAQVERGIYRRRAASGAWRYEITYSDSMGKQRWQVVPGGLREARAARGGILAKLGRGERVVKSNETFETFALAWLETADLRQRTRDTYRNSLVRHVIPIIGRRKIGTVNEDDLVRVITEMR